MTLSFSSAFISKNCAPPLIVMMTSGRGSCHPCSIKSRSRWTFWNTPPCVIPPSLPSPPPGSPLGTMRYFAVLSVFECPCRLVANERVPDTGSMVDPERLCCTQSRASFFSSSVGVSILTSSDLLNQVCWTTFPLGPGPSCRGATGATLCPAAASAVSIWYAARPAPAALCILRSSGHATFNSRTARSSASTEVGTSPVAAPVIGVTLLFTAGRRFRFLSRSGRSLRDSILACPWGAAPWLLFPRSTMSRPTALVLGLF